MIAALLLAQAVASAGGMWGFPGVAPSADEQLALPHIADAQRAATPAEARTSLDAALALLPQPTRFRAAFQCYRGTTLMRADPVANKAAGLAAIDECLKANPDVPLAQRIGADAAFGRSDWKTGATLLAKAIAAEPRLAQGLGDDQLDTIFRQLGYAQADAERRTLVAALFRTDVAKNNPARFSGWARESLLQALERGDTAAAETLLPYVVDPGDGLLMLVDRRYAALWPRLDEWAGGTLEAQRDAFVLATRASAGPFPLLGRAREIASVYARTGNLSEGLALLEGAVARFGSPRDDYDYARGVVRLAGLRAQAGERDPARITEPLTAALADGVTGPMLVNVVPNLAVMQIALGQPEAAIATLDRYPTSPDKVEARAAYGYFVALRGCAQARLGQAAAAKAALADVRAHYADNRGATNIAVACIGSDAEVLAEWVQRVDDPESRGGALMTMIAARAGVADDPLSLTDARMRTLAQAPVVSERLARYARPLPDSFRPALDGWRDAK